MVYDGVHSDVRLSRQGLPAYAAHPLLRTVGIDRTFYAPMAEADFRRYANQACAVAPVETMIESPV